jgi:hypothetical protein
MNWREFLFKIRIGTGRMFDPYWQERTDGMDDIIKAKEKRDEHKRDAK